MKRSLLVASALSAASYASACVLVDDFEGYRARPDGDPSAACDGGACPDAGPCLDSSCADAWSGSGSGSSGSGSSSSGSTACSVSVPCGAPGSPCQPVIVAPSLTKGVLSSDEESIVVTSPYGGSIRRLAKPGCSIPPLFIDKVVPISTVVSPHYMAWSVSGDGVTCATSSLHWCDPADCKPTEIPALAQHPDFKLYQGLALDADYLYFMLVLGYVGRVPRGATTHETIWSDPNYQAFMSTPTYSEIAVRDKNLYVVRAGVGQASAGSCFGGSDLLTGGIVGLEAAPGGGATAVAGGVSIPGKIAISASYVYFASFSDAIISRAPRAGGPIEKLMPAGELVKADLIAQPWLAYAPPIRVHGSWVYFASATPGGGIAIARLPADSPNWSAADAEILTRPAGELDFIVDDEALYWIECDDPAACATSTLKALVIPP